MRNRWLIGGVWLSTGLLAVALLGCKPKVPRPRPAIKIAVEGEATTTINRDVNGDPNSVVVRIYHLKDKGEFNKLTFDMVNSGRTDQELLGADFISRSEFVVVPGNTLRDTTDLAGDTKYVGVVALFRKPDPNYWRYLISMEQLNIARTRKKDWQGKKLPLFSFKIEDCFMTLNYAKPEFIPGQPLNAKPECGGAPIFAPAKLPETVPIKPVTPTTKPTTTKPATPVKPVKPVLPPKPSMVPNP
jgi:type VI secretion system protein VasD